MSGAVEALRTVADEFFVPGRRRNGKVLIASSLGVDTWTPEATAVAKYVNSVRNGVHGYSKMTTDPHQASLMANHTGYLPDNVADVPIVHVTYLMIEPRTRIHLHTPPSD